METDPNTAIKAALNARFGSDEAMGIRFFGADGVVYGPNEQIPENADVESRFPDMTSAVVCTNYAHQIARALYPRPVIIRGFANQDNPQSRVAREAIHPGGHDFAIVEGRFLVDPWIRLVACAAEQIVYDLEDPVDATAVRDLYGPAKCWSDLPLALGQCRANSLGYELSPSIQPQVA